MFYAIPFLLSIAIALTGMLVWDLVTNPKTHWLVVAVIIFSLILIGIW